MFFLQLVIKFLIKGNDSKRDVEVQAKENGERKPKEYKSKGSLRYNRRYNNEGDNGRRSRLLLNISCMFMGVRETIMFLITNI